MIQKIGVKEYLYSELSEVTSILINQDFINECTQKFEENWIDEVWNSGFALSIVKLTGDDSVIELRKAADP